MRFKAQIGRVSLCRTLIAVASLVGPPAHAGDTPVPDSFHNARTYSNLCVHPETGDVLGYRVLVQPPGRKPRIAIQFGEGGPPGDAVIAATRILPRGRLNFSISGDQEGAGISGEVRGRTVILHTPNDQPKVQRLRLRDDVHGFPDCR